LLTRCGEVHTSTDLFRLQNNVSFTLVNIETISLVYEGGEELGMWAKIHFHQDYKRKGINFLVQLHTIVESILLLHNV
jgi:hypothetical protein